MLKVHSDVNESIKCPHCDKIFRFESYLKKHLHVHSGIKPHVCPICGKPFLQAYNMKEHMLIHDKKAKEKSKIHVCTFCDKAFAQKYMLKVHMQKNHSVVEPQ